MNLKVRELKTKAEGSCSVHRCRHDWHLHLNYGWQPLDTEDCFLNSEDIIAVAVVG